MSDAPAARVLDNGHFAVRLDPLGGGWSAFDEIAVAEGNGANTGCGGVAIYVRDLDTGEHWSAGLRPGALRPDRYGAWLESAAPRLLRTDDGVETVMELALPADGAAELRRMTLTNRSDRPRRLEVTTFVPVALDRPEAFESHPAFSKLFVETAYLSAVEGLLARRRPRSPDDPAWSAVHLLVPHSDAGDEPERETDRARFLGRGHSAADPVALRPGRVALSGTVGSVLDPALCLRRAVVLEPGRSAAFTAVLAAGRSPDDARLAADPFSTARECDRAFPPTTTPAAGPNGGPALLARFGAQATEGVRDVRPARPSAAGQPPRQPGEGLLFFNGHGGFSPDGREYVIRLGEGPGLLALPPVPWVNVVANERIGFIASETGAGCTWAGNSRLNRLTPWRNDPVTDAHGEAVYLRDEDDGEFWSPLPGPCPGAGSYETRHGFGYTHHSHTGRALEEDVWQLVAPNDPVKLVRVRLRNRTRRPRSLSVFAYAEWVLGAGPEARRHVRAWPDVRTGAVFARNPATEDFEDAVAFAAVVAALPDGAVLASADGRAFLGPRCDLVAPELVRSGEDVRAERARGEDAGAALQIPLKVGGLETVEVGFLLGQAGSEPEAREMIERYRKPGAVTEALEEVEAAWEDVLGRLRVQTPSPALDLMLNGWLLYQDVTCRLRGRSAFYQSGGAFGFRDQLQDAAALIYADPGTTRAQIMLHAAHQFPEGDVLHWWHPPASAGVRTRFSDDLLWLPYVTGFYLDVTGDEAILAERAPFVRGRELKPAEDEAFMRPERTSDDADLYTHCCLALDRSLTSGSHGLPLIGSGDWNDGMNRVGHQGRGESVWLGFFLATILRRWIPLCRGRGDTGRADRYVDHLAGLERALDDAGWDGEWYRRAFYDDGDPIGSSASNECRIDAIAQAWAVISGVAPAERAERALDALERELVSEEDGLIRLLTPPFDRTPHDPGYIKGYVPGVRENGGQYTHGVLWAVRALAEAGRVERAAPLLEMLLPVTHARSPSEVMRYRVEPYVVAADVYGEEPHVGRGGWTWYTGSAAWMFRVALESVLGLEVRGGDRVRLRPRIPAAWPGFRITWRIPGGRGELRIRVRREDGVTRAWLDGQAVAVSDGVPEVPLPADGAAHELEVALGDDAARPYTPAPAMTPA